MKLWPRAPGRLVTVAPFRAWRGSLAFRRPGPTLICHRTAPRSSAAVPWYYLAMPADKDKLPVGQKAPAFSLPDQDDETVKLADYKGQWVVLYFYPKDDTPGCTTEACDFTDGIKDFEKLDAAVLGCSPDSTESHRKFIAKYKLKVRLLSDPSHAVMEKYGAWGEKVLYGKKSIGVIRSTALIDPDGKVVHHWPRVKAAGHADQVREKLKELQG